MTTERDDAMWLAAEGEVTLVELAQCSGLPEALLRELVEYGALAPRDPRSERWSFGADCVVRVRTVARLRADLELETPTLALVLGYLERIDRLEARLRALHARLAVSRR